MPPPPESAVPVTVHADGTVELQCTSTAGSPGTQQISFRPLGGGRWELTVTGTGAGPRLLTPAQIAALAFSLRHYGGEN